MTQLKPLTGSGNLFASAQKRFFANSGLLFNIIGIGEEKETQFSTPRDRQYERDLTIEISESTFITINEMSSQVEVPPLQREMILKWSSIEDSGTRKQEFEMIEQAIEEKGALYNVGLILIRQSNGKDFFQLGVAE